MGFGVCLYDCLFLRYTYMDKFTHEVFLHYFFKLHILLLTYPHISTELNKIEVHEYLYGIT